MVEVPEESYSCTYELPTFGLFGAASLRVKYIIYGSLGTTFLVLFTTSKSNYKHHIVLH